MSKELITLGPALVDVVADLTRRPQDYYAILDGLHAGPGDWVPIADEYQLNQILGILGQQLAFSLSQDFFALAQTPQISIEAGSTGLGMVSAFTPNQRRQTSVVTSIGSPDGQQPDQISTFFSSAVKDLGARHDTVPVRGINPIGLVLATADSTDKVLANFAGVAHELPWLPESVQSPRVLHIDAYELREGTLAQRANELIRSGTAPIALGLGNPQIIHGKLKAKIQEYVNDGLITYLMGNSEEYRLAFDLGPTDLEPAKLPQLGLQTKVPHILITLGAEGMAAFDRGQFAHVESKKPARIVNTSGAGDTAAGVFLSGILKNKPLEQILREATFYAAQVLGVPGNRLPEGRETEWR